MSDCEKLSSWREGMRDAAQILAIYPEDADHLACCILDSKRREILVASGTEETKPTNRQQLGDGVTAQMQGNQLCLSVKNGNEGDGVTSERAILMSKDTCEGLMRYIRQNLGCNEP